LRKLRGGGGKEDSIEGGDKVEKGIFFHFFIITTVGFPFFQRSLLFLVFFLSCFFSFLKVS